MFPGATDVEAILPPLRRWSSPARRRALNPPHENLLNEAPLLGPLWERHLCSWLTFWACAAGNILRFFEGCMRKLGEGGSFDTKVEMVYSF